MLFVGSQLYVANSIILNNFAIIYTNRLLIVTPNNLSKHAQMNQR